MPLCCPFLLPSCPPGSEISAWQFIPGGVHLIPGENEMRRIGTMCTHPHTHTTHLPTTTKGSQQCQRTVTHRHTHFLSTHWSSQTGKMNKQAFWLVFVAVCWAAKSSHCLLCCYRCLSLKKSSDVSQCFKKKGKKSPCIQKGQGHCVLSFRKWDCMCQRNICQSCMLVQAFCCTRT